MVDKICRMVSSFSKNIGWFTIFGMVRKNNLFYLKKGLTYTLKGVYSTYATY